MTKDQELRPDPLEGEVPRQARPVCQRQRKVNGRPRKIARARSSPRPRKARRRAKAKVAAKEVVKAKGRARASPKAKPQDKYVSFRQVKVGPAASRRRKKVRDEPSSLACSS